ncbi:TetR/AcrR family transcriptional regulator [Photobacterium sp. GJ3]|uniref:TetR/AcrR family transcriptional regulator n=1 Tax=Photobacterium sp. GJ3 TaxID=2829502 RepID=UPI001B8BC675|nr:TetR/AcrR family transcriptional regulator [Photobacterium sp. GJ3]QUJ68995.1 TetR/AcrR family transcriptional regulator [Photobacterium sp. GJ3]
MKKREQTRLKILDAAWLLFRENGYQDTTTRHIAEQAGVAAGTVFSHFPKKLDLLKAGLTSQIDEVIDHAESEQPDGCPRLKLLHFAKHLYTFYCEESDFSRELFRELIWQQKEFEQQLDGFRHKLFVQTSQYDACKAAVMMDCYFMTLVSGLNAVQPDAARMLKQLERKLQTFA